MLTVVACASVQGGCLATDPMPSAEPQQLDGAGHLKGPAMFADAFADAFSNAGVSIAYVKDGTSAAWSAIPTAQSFAPMMAEAPDHSGTDRIIGYTAPIFAAKVGTALAGITLTTAGAQQLICPVSGSCSTSIGGQTPAIVLVPDVNDATDSVLSDLCGVRSLCTGTVLVADGPTARQVQAGGSLTAFAVTGVGKPCTTGDNQAVCLGKYAATTGAFALADTRIQLASGIAALNLDGIAPTAANIRATYPRSKQLHVVQKTDSDSRVVAWWQWFDGDGTPSHLNHYASFASTLTTRGFVPLAGSPIVVTP